MVLVNAPHKPKESCAALRTQAEDSLRAGRSIMTVMAEYTAACDAILSRVVEALAETTLSFAVCATGGYGRCELSAYSDLDLMLLVSAGDRDAVEPIVHALWDSGLDIQITVRTITEAQEVFTAGDPRAQSALCDARFIIGDALLWAQWGVVAQRVRRSRRWRRGFVAAKRVEQQRRRARYGDTPYFREPNVKLGEGGLREWHMVWWVGVATGRIACYEDLVRKGWLDTHEYHTLQSAVQTLHHVRWALHILAGRRQDRLGFDEQAHLVQDFGALWSATDSSHLLQQVYQAMDHIDQISEWLLWRWEQRSSQRLWRRLRRLVTWRPTIQLGTHTVVVPDRVQRTEQVYEIFWTIAQTGRPLDPASHHTVWRCGAHATIDGAVAAVPWNPMTVGPHVVAMLQEMSSTGWLHHVFPEFSEIRHLAQRDAYHALTVDQHLIEAVRHCARVLRAPVAQLLPGLAQARATVTDTAALRFATLYHDVAKGRPGSHAQQGAELAFHRATAFGFSLQQCRRIAYLVRAHQTMTRLAFSRDITDPALITRFAQTIETRERLAALYLLTVADMQAVAPQVYTSWKAGLLDQLYLLTDAAMQQRPAIAVNREQLLAQVWPVMTGLLEPRLHEAARQWVEQMPSRYLRVMDPAHIADHVQCGPGCGADDLKILHRTDAQGLLEIDVITLNQRGLFAKLCGVLTGYGLDVVETQLCTGRQGAVVDRFRCLPNSRLLSVVDWEVFITLVRDVVVGTRVVHAAGADQESAGHRPQLGLVVDPTVSIDNTVSEDYTVIDVVAGNRLGLLYDVTQYLFEQGCDLVSAHIVTKGVYALDAFYVQNIDGEQITDPKTVAALTAGVTTVARGEH